MPGNFDGISFGVIPKERFDEVIVHLRDNFFADEPLNYSVSLCRTGEPHVELEEHSLSTLMDGLSQMAVDDATGEVIGVALNGSQHPGDLIAAQAKLDTLSDTKFHRIFSLLYGVNIALDLFKAYHVDKIFECRILSVDAKFRGRGLARELLRRSEDVAKEAGFKMMKEDATGLFSQRVAQSLGYETVHQIQYSEYISKETSEPVFSPPPPHEYLKIMIKMLQ